MKQELWRILNWLDYWLIILGLFICILIAVAFLTVAERKTLGYMQRRLGPNAVGYYGVLMAFADALKLLSKEIVFPHNSEVVYVISGPLITLFSVLLSWSVIPFGPGLSILDSEYAIIYLLATGSIGVFGNIIVGWMSNSKYTILATIRTTAQLISYELILTTITFTIVLLISSLNITKIIEYQTNIWLIIVLLPLSIIFFISALAETARPPFDNIEAESELVSGHMTELSASPFVIFFLSEYCSIVLMSTLTSIYFFGGYLPFSSSLHQFIFSFFNQHSLYYLILEGSFFGSYIGLKANFFMFTFIWCRASWPRLRYDLLITFCWYVLLPLVFAIVIFIPGLLYSYNALPLGF